MLFHRKRLERLRRKNHGKNPFIAESPGAELTRHVFTINEPTLLMSPSAKKLSLTQHEMSNVGMERVARVARVAIFLCNKYIVSNGMVKMIPPEPPDTVCNEMVNMILPEPPPFSDITWKYNFYF